jgi:hypothetical protein
MKDNGDRQDNARGCNEDIRDYTDRAKRTAWTTQDSENRQDYKEPRRQIGLLVQRVKRPDRIKHDY